MQVEFHDNYLLAIVVFLLFICNVRTCCECLRDWVQVCHECSCLTPDCLGFQLHFCVKDCWHVVLRRALITFCFLQPVTLCVISIMNRFRDKENTASTVILCTTAMNHSLFVYKDSRSLVGNQNLNENNSTVSLSPTTGQVSLYDHSHDYILRTSCAQIDYLMLCIPHALLVSVTTLTWLQLISKGVLYESLQWDESIYSEQEGAVFLYDVVYYAEVLSMNVFFIFLAVDNMHQWSAYYIVLSLTMIMVFFMNMVRYKIETALDGTSTMIGSTVIACIVIPYILDLLQTQTRLTGAVLIVHIFCVLLLTCGHYMASGQATAAYVLSLRIFVTVCACVFNIVLVSYGVNRLR